VDVIGAADSGNNPPHGHVSPPPDNVLRGFPRATRTKGKSWFAGGLRRRWKDPGDGMIYEWDYQHGTVERYTARGVHIGEFDPATGQQVGPAKPERTVEP
jgi:Cytotoxic